MFLTVHPESAPPLEHARWGDKIGRTVKTEAWRAWKAEFDQRWQAQIEPFERAKAALQAAEAERAAASDAVHVALLRAADIADELSVAKRDRVHEICRGLDDENDELSSENERLRAENAWLRAQLPVSSA